MAERETSGLTHAERRAALVRKILKEAAKRIPGLKAPHKPTARKLTGHRTVPKKFIQGIIFAADANQQLRAISKFDVDEARAALEFQAAFRPVADQLALILASVNYTIDSRMAPVAAGALRTYTVAKALARDGGKNSDLTQQGLRALKRDLGRIGPGKKKKATTRGSKPPKSD
jgi:hypothetical protein